MAQELSQKPKFHRVKSFWFFLSVRKDSKLKPYKFDLNVLYEDEHILVLNKKAGMVVHPGDGTNNETLVHALLHHCEENLSPIGAPLRLVSFIDWTRTPVVQWWWPRPNLLTSHWLNNFQTGKRESIISRLPVGNWKVLVNLLSQLAAIQLCG